MKILFISCPVINFYTSELFWVTNRYIITLSSCNCHDGKSPWVWKWCARILSKFLVLRRRVPLKGRVFLSPPPPFITTPLPLPLLLSYQTVRFLSSEVKTVRVPIYYAPTGGRFPPATERMNDLAVLVSSNEWSLQYTKSYNCDYNCDYDTVFVS